MCWHSVEETVCGCEEPVCVRECESARMRYVCECVWVHERGTCVCTCARVHERGETETKRKRGPWPSDFRR
jgi:hypothetical protein